MRSEQAHGHPLTWASHELLAVVLDSIVDLPQPRDVVSSVGAIYVLPYRRRMAALRRVMLVSRAFADEARKLIYTHIALQADNFKATCDALRAQPERLAHVRSLAFGDVAAVWNEDAARSLLEGCSELRSVVLTRRLAWFFQDFVWPTTIRHVMGDAPGLTDESPRPRAMAVTDVQMSSPVFRSHASGCRTLQLSRVNVQGTNSIPAHVRALAVAGAAKDMVVDATVALNRCQKQGIPLEDATVHIVCNASPRKAGCAAVVRPIESLPASVTHLTFVFEPPRHPPDVDSRGRIVMTALWQILDGSFANALAVYEGSLRHLTLAVQLAYPHTAREAADDVRAAMASDGLADVERACAEAGIELHFDARFDFAADVWVR